MNGKGSAPRNCFSPEFRQGWEQAFGHRSHRPDGVKRTYHYGAHRKIVVADFSLPPLAPDIYAATGEMLEYVGRSYVAEQRKQK